MIMICHPPPLLTAGGGNGVGGASRINPAGGTPGNLTQRCPPLPRLMVSIKLIQEGLY